MRFIKPKKFLGNTLEAIADYLTRDLSTYLADLFTGLSFLDFKENFKALEWSGTIGSGSEAKIPHNFGVIPRYWLLVRCTGTRDIIDGTTAWDESYVYIKNAGGTSADVTVLIMR